MLWHERGGRGDDAYLLLHGLGATGAVWGNVCRELDRRGRGEWLIVDLPGHGGSEALPQYSVGALASAVAQGLNSDQPYRIIGHSLGAYVGLALASGWFGVRIASVLGIGPKIAWSEADLAATRELARKPARQPASNPSNLAQRQDYTRGAASKTTPGWSAPRHNHRRHFP